MKQQIKHDYRVAGEILRAIQFTKSTASRESLRDAVTNCEHWQNSLALATDKNWKSAANRSAEKLRSALETLRHRTTHAIDQLAPRATPGLSPTAKSIFLDIDGLRGEFDSVTIDRSKQELSVQTASISLEDVLLGSFEIRLNWSRIKEMSPYEIVALDHCSCASSDRVTHPHVQSGALCEGEGADAIRRALDEGRLYDFFCVVDQVLRTYNPDSAYVQLDDWHGVSCRACGDRVDSDSLVSCGKCETELCIDCGTSCDSCSDRYCSECISSCQCCGDDTCQMCLKSCDDCGEDFCNSCLFEGTCDDCITQQNEAKNDAEEQESGVAVHTVCDGKTALPA